MKSVGPSPTNLVEILLYGFTPVEVTIQQMIESLRWSESLVENIVSRIFYFTLSRGDMEDWNPRWRKKPQWVLCPTEKGVSGLGEGDVPDFEDRCVKGRSWETLLRREGGWRGKTTVHKGSKKEG